jgi:hypothetical protein
MTAFDPRKQPDMPTTGEATFGARPEPLPPEFDRELQAIDRLLSTSAGVHRNAMPAGLAQRAFEASVADLPQATTHAPLRLVGVGDAPEVAVAADGGRRVAHGWLGQSLWNRVALAASVALVGGVGLWVMVQRSNVPVAPREDATHLARTDVSLNFDDLDRLALGIGDFESEVSYLIEATELHSVYDLTDDLDLLAQQSEM